MHLSYEHLTHLISLDMNSNRNDYCNKSRNRCERATGQSCSQGVDCGNGQGSQWMCRQGRCQPRSLFEMAMMETE